MKLCNSCVMPETTETQLFDTKGTCSVCNQQNTKKNIDWKNRQKQFEDLLKKYPNQLSAGESQKVSIAKAFIFNGDIFVC